MQRVQLHLKGVSVPKLGSLQDRIFRQAIQQEKMLEVKRMEFIMMLTAVSKQTTDPGVHREWVSSVKGMWRSYIGVLLNVEMPEHSESEEELLQYYSSVVKHLRPTARKTKQGTIEVTGLDILRR